MGASNTYVPYKEINAYLASKIFESFGHLNKKVPSKNDLDEFIRSNGLTYEDISKELIIQVPTVPKLDVDTKTLYEQCKGIFPDMIPAALSPMRDYIPKIAGVLEENKKNLTNGAESIKSISSLISRVKKSLIQIASDSEKGPYFATSLLYSNANNHLITTIKGYEYLNYNKLALLKEELELIEKNTADTLRMFQNSKGLKKRKRKTEYIEFIHRYFLIMAKINHLVVLQELLKTFILQLEDLYEQFFKKFVYTLNSLYETFSENLYFLAESHCYNDVSKPIITISELKPYLDATISEIKIPYVVNQFIYSFINDENIWISQDENKIFAAVSRFFLSELYVFINKNIIDYLQIKFNTTESNIIECKTYEEIMIPVYESANPLLWNDENKYLISYAGNIGFCSIPEISPQIQSAADELCRSDNTIIKRVVNSSDRISISKVLYGVPMFAYKGASEYYDIYRNNQLEGIHIYEGYGKDGKNFRNIPNIIPSELID